MINIKIIMLNKK